ncbi:MAG: ATP-binding protein [Clostridia bacterium]|nr:ATP-binding protein [Clostridia bacterium]
MKEFDKTVGYKNVKIELERICDIIRNPEKYRKLGVSTPKGLLLYGNPGLGKTLMAKCVVEASGRKSYVLRKTMPDGDFVKEISAIFSEAKENAPSVVFLDDIDKFANEDDYHKNAEEYVTIQSCIDDCKDEEVFVLATANELDSLPDSLLRAGRFEKTIKIKNYLKSFIALQN